MANLYRFGQFVLDPARRTLSRPDSPILLTPKALDVLIFLVQNANRLVTKEELLQAVWGDTFVEEGNLTQYISHLRKALADNPEDSRLIVTIARKGYQFTGDVSVGEPADVAKQVTAHISSTEHRQADTLRGIEGRESRAPKYWRKAAVIAVCAVILVVGGYISRRHFRAVAPPKSGKIMLAVLPFENLTGDPNKEYLADGLTEEMISQLGQLNPEQLGVIARTSVMGYEHSEERLDQIGRDLSVQYVLEDSLQQSGDHLRITVQLIQVKDQSHLWSHDYDYRAQDILTVEDDVAEAVAREIQLRLDPEKQAELARPLLVNPEAFDAYLQGYYYFQRDTNEDTNMAAKYFERATQVDPNYALAWVGLSRARNWQAVTGLIPAERGHQLAREAVERALALNPNLAEAHVEMARIKRQVDFDWAGADASVKRAMALEPGDPEILDFAAADAAILGRLDEALQLARRALDLDPLNARSWGQLGEIEFQDGKLDEAEADLKKALALRADEFGSLVFLSESYVMQGRPQDALPEIERVRYDDIRMFLHAVAYYALGRKTESDAALTQLIAKYQAIDTYLIAQVYAFRNQLDQAFAWLDRAYAKRNDGLIFMKADPLLKNLHSDPRFAALLKKLNLPN